VRAVLLFLFFLSGGCALVYQVVWVRMLGLVFGVTSFAVATVLAAFMGGLALGSYCGGRLIDRCRRPLLVFSGLQLGIGGFALAFPVLLSALTAVYVGVYRMWPTTFYLFSVMRFLLAFLLLLVPTTLMGATLPVLVKGYVKRLERLGSDVGALYSMNNWGAAAGAILAGFVLIQSIGVRETSYVAAAASLGIGLITLALGLFQKPLPPVDEVSEPESAPDEGGPRYSRRVTNVVLWVFAIEGFTSLGYEVVWTRILSSSRVVVTTYAYSLVTATFIAGLALGSMLVRRLVDRKADLVKWLGGIEIAIAASAALLLPLFSVSGWGVFQLSGSLPGWGKYTAATAAWLGLLLLIPTTLMGATFPLVSRIYTVSLKELGRRIGKVGCLDTVGSIFGAFAGGFILIPLLGMQRSVLWLAVVNAAIGLWALLAHPTMGRKAKLRVTAGVMVGAFCVWVVIPAHVQFVPLRFGANPNLHVIGYDEGVTATVMVRQWMDGNRSVAVDGTEVAGTSRMLQTTQITQAHLPMLLYEAHNGRRPRRAMTIGLGSGQTVSSLALYDLEDIHGVELVPGVVRSAKKYFGDLNRHVFDDPRVKVFIQDARTFVLAADEKYDVIMDDSVHPAWGGNSSLYSRDFFAHCRERLTDDGVMSVWMPMFGLSKDDLQMIFRSFLDVYPHATLWRAANDHNKHMVLIGTRERLRIDFQKFRDRVAQPEVRDDLARVDLDDAYALVNCLLLDEQGLREYSKGARIHSDNHPYLAFSTPKHVLASPEHPIRWLDRLSELLDMRADVRPLLSSLGESEAEVAEAEERLALQHEVVGRLSRAFSLYGTGHLGRALPEAEAVLQMDPQNKSAAFLKQQCLLGQITSDLRAGMLQDAIDRSRALLESDPDIANAYVIIAQASFFIGGLDEAQAAAEKALELAPDHLGCRLILAQVYMHKGLGEKAQAQIDYVLNVIPEEPTALEVRKQLNRRR